MNHLRRHTMTAVPPAQPAAAAAKARASGSGLARRSKNGPMPAIMAALMVTGLPAPLPAVDVTDAVTQGIGYLRQQAATNDQGWFFPPLEGKKVIGWKTNIVMLKEVVRERPVYEYETYEVLVPGNSPTDPPRRETRRRIRGVRTGAVERITQWVPAKDGTVAREQHIPIYAPTDANRWRYGGLGLNAAAVYALRRCGVAADDPLLAEPAATLAHFVETFGVPDHTLDVAWLTTAFAGLPGERFQELTQQCAGKLLDAQVAAGPAAGLWGPVAIPTGLLAGYLQWLTRLEDELQTARKALAAEQRDAGAANKSRPSQKAQRLQERIAALETARESAQRDLMRVSQTGSALFDALGRHFKEPIQLRVAGEQIALETLPYLIHNQRTVDLESTALAVLALRVAAEHRRLPARSWRPTPPRDTGPVEWPAAREAREVVALAAQVITAARAADGTWTEMNLQMPVTDFAWLKTIPPARPETFTPLPSPVTFNSVARGAATMMNLEILWSGPARAALALTNDAVRRRLAVLRAGTSEATGNPRGAFDVLPLLARGGPAVDAWEEVAEWLLRTQTAAGGWGPAGQELIASTSLLARMQTTPPTTGGKMHEYLDQPHLVPIFHHRASLLGRYGAPSRTLATVCALMFLAEGLPADWTPPVPAASPMPAPQPDP